MWKYIESIKLNVKEIVHKHFTVLWSVKLCPTGYRLPSLKLLDMHIGIEQLGKWIAKSRNKFLPVGGGGGVYRKTRGGSKISYIA